MTVARIVEDIMRALFGSDTDTLADQDNCVSLSSLIGDQYNFVRIGGLGGASAILMALYVSSQLQDVHDVRKGCRHILWLVGYILYIPLPCCACPWYTIQKL